MANMADEELAEFFSSAAMEDLTEADLAEKSAADEEFPEEIKAVPTEALADESAADEELAEEIKAVQMEALAEEIVAEEGAAADDGELTQQGWEHFSRGDLVHDLCYTTMKVLLNFEMPENVEELCDYAVAMVSNLFLKDDDYKTFAVKFKGIETDMKTMLWQILHGNFYLFEEKRDGESDGEESTMDIESDEESVEDLEIDAKANIAGNANARYLNIN